MLLEVWRGAPEDISSCCVDVDERVEQALAPGSDRVRAIIKFGGSSLQRGGSTSGCRKQGPPLASVQAHVSHRQPVLEASAFSSILLQWQDGLICA